MKPDFIVIGAGIIGLATAQRLLAQGAAVTVLERGLAGQESSWAGGGILSPLCPWDYPDEVTRLTTYGAALFPAWAASLHEATGIDPEYEVSGMLVLPPSPLDTGWDTGWDAQAARQWCAVHGVRVEEKTSLSLTLSLASLSPREREREQPPSPPWGESWREGDALFLPDVAQVRNPRLLRALRQQVVALGGRMVEHCTVREIVTDSVLPPLQGEGWGGDGLGHVQSLDTSCGAFSAGNYIVTAGAWSKEVLGQYALQLDINPVRGQMLLFKFDAPPLNHIVLQGDLYLIPRRDGHLLVGSTLEEVGFDQRTTVTAHDDLYQRAQRLLPQLCDMPLVRHWAGLRPASPRNIPTIARHPQLDNLYLNSGHFRYGVTMAPASVEILLNELAGAPQPFDVAPYRAGWGV